ncbi:phosphonoacetaldehyde hydrolase-like [Antedon mediterranea]|uniref:phosphonoacetaldehyde hydrolase-like n=1 Tax=Antedon mediterranea TaxID=105859 RepID=UPI003AF43B78
MLRSGLCLSRLGSVTTRSGGLSPCLDHSAARVNSTQRTKSRPNQDILQIQCKQNYTAWTNPRMPYQSIRSYQGPLKAVVFDWGGTVVDSGVMGPAITFVRIFKEEGIDITDDEARGPMGTHKRVHIQKVLQNNAVLERWLNQHGREPTDEDIDRMYHRFIPVQLEVLKDYCSMITGAAEAVKVLRNEYNLKIGSSTGWSSEIVNEIKPIAAAAGYVPDCYVAADEVPQARPLPYMVWLNAIRMDIHPLESIIKVDDTFDGIREGTSAGCWTVGVAKYGNYVAATEDQISRMNPREYERKLQHAYDVLSDAGSHYVVDSVSDLPGVVEDINQRLARGERP